MTAACPSPLARAIDFVFRGMSEPASGAPATGGSTSRGSLLLEAEPREDGTIVLLANGIPIVRLGGEAELAPTLEGTLVGHAVRGRRDCAVFHAASVQIEGRGVLMPGGKGSGKSTLALAMGRRGVTYLGDELGFVRFSDARLEAFPKAATLKVGSFDLFPEDVTHDDPIRGPVRYFLPEAAAPVGHSTAIDLIIFPRYVADPTEVTVTQMLPGEVAFGLIREAFGGLDRDPRMLGLVANLARLPAYLLESSDTEAAEGAIRALLDGAPNAASGRDASRAEVG